MNRFIELNDIEIDSVSGGEGEPNGREGGQCECGVYMRIFPCKHENGTYMIDVNGTDILCSSGCPEKWYSQPTTPSISQTVWNYFTSSKVWINYSISVTVGSLAAIIKKYVFTKVKNSYVGV